MDDEFFIRHCFESIVAFDHLKSHGEKQHHRLWMFPVHKTGYLSSFGNCLLQFYAVFPANVSVNENRLSFWGIKPAFSTVKTARIPVHTGHKHLILLEWISTFSGFCKFFFCGFTVVFLKALLTITTAPIKYFETCA